jgi:hypothetical protein
MTYTISISGHADSKKAEAAILAKAVALVEDIGAEGAFSFHGSELGSVYASAPQEAVAAAKELLAAYAADADADDQLEAPTLNTRNDGR